MSMLATRAVNPAASTRTSQSRAATIFAVPGSSSAGSANIRASREAWAPIAARVRSASPLHSTSSASSGRQRARGVLERLPGCVEARDFGRRHQPREAQARARRAVGPEQRHRCRALRRNEHAVSLRETRGERGVARGRDQRQTAQRFDVLRRERTRCNAWRNRDAAFRQRGEHGERQARCDIRLRGECGRHFRDVGNTHRRTRRNRGEMRARVARAQARRLRGVVRGDLEVAARQRDFGEREPWRREGLVEIGRRLPCAHRVVGKAKLPEHFAEMEMRHRRARVLARRTSEARNRIGGPPLAEVHAASCEPIVESRGRHRTRPKRDRTPSRAASFACRRDAARRTRAMKPVPFLRHGPVGARHGR